jgi:hypothetical protein
MAVMVPDMVDEALTATGADTVEPAAGDVTVTPVAVVLELETVKEMLEDFEYCPAEFQD